MAINKIPPFSCFKKKMGDSFIAGNNQFADDKRMFANSSLFRLIKKNLIAVG